MWAIDHNNISITPVFTNRTGEELSSLLDTLSAGLLEELKKANE